MNVVVTKNKVDYLSSFLKVSSLSEACQIEGTIDVLVYNNSSEDSDKKRECLGILKDRAKKLVYICDEKKVDMSVKMMIIGSDGKYFDDEFFLESADELRNLVDSLEEITALANLGGVNVLSDFFNRYLKNGSSSFSSNYLMVVKDAVNTLMSEYNQKNLEIIRMSETATDVFATTSALLSSMKKENENAKKLAERMSATLSEPTNPVRRVVGSSVMFYPRVTNISSKSIIRVKEIGNSEFLVSCMLGLRIYLESVKHFRPKLLFLVPVGDLVEKLYNSYNWVNQSNSKNLSVYSTNVLFTNCPSKEVIDNWLNDDNYDTYIIVDKLLFDKEHLLNCKGTSVKYAIGSVGCIDKFKLNRRDCISSITEIQGTLGVIPMFKEYPNDVSARERMYMSSMSTFYEKMILGMKRG